MLNRKTLTFVLAAMVICLSGTAFATTTFVPNGGTVIPNI